jgi:hypothetical protein
MPDPVEVVFFSDTNQSLFEYDLVERGVAYVRGGEYRVMVTEPPPWLPELVSELGGEFMELADLRWL